MQTRLMINVTRRKALEERGVFAGIMHRPNQYHPLKPAQAAFNKRMTKLRAPVEHVFGILKNHYRLRRARYIGLTRTAVQITLACMAMNIKRCLVLARTQGFPSLERKASEQCKKW